MAEGCFWSYAWVVGWHPVGDSNPCCRRERAVLTSFWALFYRVSGLFWAGMGGYSCQKLYRFHIGLLLPKPLIVAYMETMLCPCSLSRLLKCLGSRSAFAANFPHPFRRLTSLFLRFDSRTFLCNVAIQSWRLHGQTLRRLRPPMRPAGFFFAAVFIGFFFFIGFFIYPGIALTFLLYA